MTQTFKSLSQYLTSPNIILKEIEDMNDHKMWIYQDHIQTYILTFVNSNPTKKISNICLGYCLTKEEKKQNDADISFKDGTGFVMHSLTGPASLHEAYTVYRIHGQSIYQEEFDFHPEVRAYHNKISLKKKLEDL